jgi:hypothetical protein
MNLAGNYMEFSENVGAAEPALVITNAGISKNFIFL